MPVFSGDGANAPVLHGRSVSPSSLVPSAISEPLLRPSLPSVHTFSSQISPASVGSGSSAAVSLPVPSGDDASVLVLHGRSVSQSSPM